MKGYLCYICAHIAGPGEPPEDSEMNEMTLPYRHMVRNLSSGGLRPSILSLSHGRSPQYKSAVT